MNYTPKLQPKAINTSIIKNKWFLLSLLFFFITANSFAVYFIRQEHFFYYWDTLEYWKKFTYLSDHFLKNPFNTITTVIYSIREDNYNDLAAFILMPFGFVFGTSRLAYILSIVNIFGIPVVISLIFLYKKLENSLGPTLKYFPLIIAGVVLLSPNFWDPILKGSLDVGGIVLINIILLLYFNKPLSKQTKLNFLLIAVLIPTLVLFRRWYAYWGAAFYTVVFLETCLMAFLTSPFDLKLFVKNILKIFLQASLSAIFFFTVATTFAERILKTNYSDLNSAYKYCSNLFESFEMIFKNVGLLHFSLFLLGATYCLINEKTRRLTVFLLLQSLIIFVLFARTQDFDTHQFYLLLPPILLFSSLFILCLIHKYNRLKVFIIMSVGVLLFLNFLTAFTPSTSATPSIIFTDLRLLPHVRNDIKEVEKILKTFKKLLTDPRDRVYVLSSSAILNQNTLDSAYMSIHRYKDVSGKILPTHNMDKRDGFPQELLIANYVVIASPIQYEMEPKDQHVVGIPAEQILKQQGIGTSFVKLPYEFTLDKNVKVHIYKKIKPIREADIAELSDLLKKYYPNRPNVYQINPELMYRK